MNANTVWQRAAWLCIVAIAGAGCATTDKNPEVATSAKHVDAYEAEIY